MKKYSNVLFLLFLSLSMTYLNAQTPPSDKNLANQYLRDARIFRTEGAFAQSNQLLQMASKLFEANGMWTKYCTAQDLLAENFLTMNLPDSVQVVQDRLIKVSIKELGKNNRFEMVGYIRLSKSLLLNKKFDATLDVLDLALDLTKKKPTGKETELTQIYTLKGEAYLAKKEWKAALLAFESANEYTKGGKVTELPILASFYKGYATTLEKLKRYGEAGSWAQKNIELAALLYGPTSKQLADAFRVTAHINYEAAAFETAKVLMEKSIKIYEKNPKLKEELAAAFEENALILSAMDKHAEALKFLEQSAALYTNILGNKHVQISKVYGQMASVQLKTGQLDAMEQSLQKAMLALMPFNQKMEKGQILPDNDDLILSPNQMLVCLQLKLAYYQNRYGTNKESLELQACLKIAAKAELFWGLNHSEQLILTAPEEIVAVNKSICMQAAWAAEELSTIKKDPTYSALALAWIEKWHWWRRANLLSEIQLYMPNPVLSKLNAQKLKNVQLIDSMQQALLAKNTELVASLNNAYLEEKNKHGLLLTLLKKEFPKYYEWFYQGQPFKVTALQEKLENGAQTIVFAELESTYYRFTLSKNGLTAKVIEKDKNLKHALFVVKDYWKNAAAKHKDPLAWEQFAQSSALIYERLLADFLTNLPEDSKQLIIIADGELLGIPFELLLTAPSPKLNKEVAYLLKKYSVRYRLSLVDNSTQNQANAQKLLLYFPNYKELPEGDELLGNTYKLAQKWEGGTRSGNKYRRYLAGDLRQNYDATEQRFVIQDFSDYAILHLGAYATIDSNLALQSGIVFNYEHDSLYDGVLRVEGFSHLNWSLDLLLFPGTGGEDLFSNGKEALLQGFSFIGSKNVVFSLWNSPEKHTRKVIRLFYEELAKGTTQEEALRLAKLEYLSSADASFIHPYYWAALVQFGEGGTAPLSIQFNFPWLPIGGICALLILVIGWWIRKKR